MKLFALIIHHDASDHKWTEKIIEAIDEDQAWNIIQNMMDAGLIFTSKYEDLDYKLVPINAVFH